MASNHVSYDATASNVRLTRPPLNGSKHSSSSIQRTKVLVLGLRRSGKSSILQVLFNDLPPNQSFYLEPTYRIAKTQIDTVVPLELWDTPGHATPESIGIPIGDFRSLIFVIDIRDLYNQPITKLVSFVTAAFQSNPDINIEVFVHKSEKLQEDDKIENFRQIQERVTDRLLDLAPEYENIQPNFYLTSIYDHSLHEAFSRVLHKLIDSIPYLEDMLNVFCANSQSPKAFLFDTKSRLSASVSASRHSPPEDPQSLSSNDASSTSSPIMSTDGLPHASKRTPKEMFYPSAATSLHPSTPGTTLTYHEITSSLALMALVPTSVYEGRRGLLEYNVVFFREGVQEICDVEKETREVG
ncbi:hypothetical protein NP233_g7804 [Leucocoprinus birnbaumii]|uniref:GTP-binding protein n=1 Tax=Leucocoprinus birnbaumii TaxID=56174 RepID=A0AAD5VRX3_9AGAR|nr:hypothetical protein NP233_g7804 [Leucocoprinus birnbaumii]